MATITENLKRLAPGREIVDARRETEMEEDHAEGEGGEGGEVRCTAVDGVRPATHTHVTVIRSSKVRSSVISIEEPSLAELTCDERSEYVDAE